MAVRRLCGGGQAEEWPMRGLWRQGGLPPGALAHGPGDPSEAATEPEAPAQTAIHSSPQIPQPQALQQLKQ